MREQIVDQYKRYTDHDPGKDFQTDTSRPEMEISKWQCQRHHDENGKRVWFYFNYSHTPAEAVYAGADGVYLMKEDQTFPEINVAAGEKLALGSWDVQIIREK